MFIDIIRCLLISLLGAGVVTYSASNDHSKNLRIGVLRHINIEEAQRFSIDSYAEQLLVAAATSRGHHIEFVNPLAICSTQDSVQYDAIISRAEVDAFADNLTDAYLRALDYFETLGVPIINSSRATIYAQDKFRTLLLAQKAGIPIPPTFMVYSLEDIYSLINAEEILFPFFVKRPYSGCGKGVFLVHDEHSLRTTITQYFQVGEPILVEERVDLETDSRGNVKDMRIWVVRDSLTNRAKFVGGVYRIAVQGNYLTNVSAGGSVSTLDQPCNQKIVTLSQQALEAIGADVAGIDLAQDKSGNLYLLEINISFYTPKSIQQVIGINIWELVLDLVEARVKQNVSR